MRRIRVWLLVLCCLPMGAYAQGDARIKRLEAAIAQANQEQQALHMQVQLILELRRAESEYFTAAMPQAGSSAPPMNYDDIERLRREHQDRLKAHSDELSRLYERFKQIEQERQSLREQLNQLLTAPD